MNINYYFDANYHHLWLSSSLAFYLLFTSLIDMPADAKSILQKYMYSMTVFSLMGFCLMQFPLEIIEERNSGWYKRLISTDHSVKLLFS